MNARGSALLFARRNLLTFCIALLLAGLVGRLSAQTAPTQSAPTQPAPASQPAQVSSQPASTQAYNLPPDKLAKAITLGHISTALDIVGSLWGIAVLWLLLASRWAAGFAAWAESVSRRRWLQGLLFFVVLLVITTLAGLPLDVIGHAVSRYYGISVQGWGSWLEDLGKGLCLTVLFGAPVLLLFNWIVRVSPRRYWMWIWLVSLPLIVLSVFAAPLLDPIFNKFEPLTKASTKSNGLNAYVTGIGATKRFVMWDTATDRLPDDEVLFIFGHESGHYVLNHIPQELSGMAAGMFFVFWACAGFAGWSTRRFGIRWQLGEPYSGFIPLASRQGFVVLLFALSIASFILQPAGNTFSRHFEHEADVYGQEAIHGLVADPQKTAVSAFNHMGEAWLEDPNPSPFIEFWEYGHPSVQTRANFAAHYDPWAKGGRGRFFEK